MSIVVVCKKCRKSFKVSDKFAGQSGACPNCKATLKVPDKTEEVKVHAPDEFADGGRSINGELITKPIDRKDAKLEPVTVVAIGGAALTVLLITWFGGQLIGKSLVVRSIGLLLVSPALVVAAYTFLRDDELAPHRGTTLYVRSAICAVAYVILWGAYGYLDSQGVVSGELWTWLAIAAAFCVTGALVALACLDLNFGSGFFHYAFYVLVTILLRWAAGMGWLWEVTNTSAC